jgi:pyruvate carboxylase
MVRISAPETRVGEYRDEEARPSISVKLSAMHPRFERADYTTRFIDETPELFRIPRKRDRATRVLRFVADVIVNGNAEVAGRLRPPRMTEARPPRLKLHEPPPGTKQKLDELGPERFARWMLDQPRVLLTDTTFRDAHQSLLATRIRTRDLVAIAPYYARLVPNLFSVECWGGATFDVAMRFLRECPWERLIAFREAMPNLLLQMLLRSANAVGYTNYPDNVVRYFVDQAAKHGVDLFRVFDSLNWVENMRVAIDAVRETGRLCEAAICYTGNLSDPRQTKYDLGYYVRLAKELERAGAHILGIKDMAGLCQPRAAHTLVKALKQEIGIPVHFHTHDTSGIAAASVLTARRPVVSSRCSPLPTVPPRLAPWSSPCSAGCGSPAPRSWSRSGCSSSSRRPPGCTAASSTAGLAGSSTCSASSPSSRTSSCSSPAPCSPQGARAGRSGSGCCASTASSASR